MPSNQEELVLQAPWRLCLSQFSPGDVDGADPAEGKVAAPWRIQETPRCEMEANTVTNEDGTALEILEDSVPLFGAPELSFPKGLAGRCHASASPLAHRLNSALVAAAATEPLPSSQDFPVIPTKGSPTVSKEVNSRPVTANAAVNSPSFEADTTPPVPAAALVQQLLTLQHSGDHFGQHAFDSRHAGRASHGIHRHSPAAPQQHHQQQQQQQQHGSPQTQRTPSPPKWHFHSLASPAPQATPPSHLPIERLVADLQLLRAAAQPILLEQHPLQHPSRQRGSPSSTGYHVPFSPSRPTEQIHPLPASSPSLLQGLGFGQRTQIQHNPQTQYKPPSLPAPSSHPPLPSAKGATRGAKAGRDTGSCLAATRSPLRELVNGGFPPPLSPITPSCVLHPQQSHTASTATPPHAPLPAHAVSGTQHIPRSPVPGTHPALLRTPTHAARATQLHPEAPPHLRSPTLAPHSSSPPPFSQQANVPAHAREACGQSCPPPALFLEPARPHTHPAVNSPTANSPHQQHAVFELQGARARAIQSSPLVRTSTPMQCSPLPSVQPAAAHAPSPTAAGPCAMECGDTPIPATPPDSTCSERRCCWLENGQEANPHYACEAASEGQQGERGGPGLFPQPTSEQHQPLACRGQASGCDQDLLASVDPPRPPHCSSPVTFSGAHAHAPPQPQSDLQDQHLLAVDQERQQQQQPHSSHLPHASRRQPQQQALPPPTDHQFQQHGCTHHPQDTQPHVPLQVAPANIDEVASTAGSTVLQQAVAFVDPHLPPDVQHQVRLNLSKTGALIHDGSSCHLSAKCTCVVCDPERAPAWLSHCVDIFSPAWVAHCAKEGNRGRPMPRVVSMSADIARHLQRSALAVASDGRACGEAAALSAGDFVQGEGCSLLRAGGADLANVPLSSCCLSAAGTAKAVVEEQGVAAQGGPSGHVTCEGDATAALAGVGVQGAGATWLCADHSRGLGAEGVLGCKGCESGAAVSMPGADKARAQQLGSSTGRQQLVKELKALEGSRGRGACGARSGAAAGVTLAPLTLLEGVAWELQHPPSSATRCPIATPLGCSTHPMQGPGQPSDSELEPQLQLIEHEGGAAKPEQLLEEVVFRVRPCYASAESWPRGASVLDARSDPGCLD
uniref:BRCT domain-containing protein n=1 Tax=Dunaliella tertiolecta TaxID=3047 RepID=A0A7S3R5N7_DUNTE